MCYKVILDSPTCKVSTAITFLFVVRCNSKRVYFLCCLVTFGVTLGMLVMISCTWVFHLPHCLQNGLWNCIVPFARFLIDSAFRSKPVGRNAPQPHCVVIYSVRQKRNLSNFLHNFSKPLPIFKITSLFSSVFMSLQNTYFSLHLTCVTYVPCEMTVVQNCIYFCYRYPKCYFQQDVNFCITADERRSSYPLSCSHTNTKSSRPQADSFVKDTFFQADLHASRMPELSFSLSHKFMSNVVRHCIPMMYSTKCKLLELLGGTDIWSNENHSRLLTWLVVGFSSSW